MPQAGIHTVTVPGAVAGWDGLRAKLGSLPFSDLLAPAITYADEGFPVSDVIAAHWDGLTNKLACEPSAEDLYLPNGRAPRAGEVFRNPGARGVAPPHRRARPGRLLRRARPLTPSSRSQPRKAAR